MSEKKEFTTEEAAEKLAKITSTGVDVIATIEGGCVATIVYSYVKGVFKPKKLWQKAVVLIGAYALGETFAAANSERVKKLIYGGLAKIAEMVNVEVVEEESEDAE